MSEYWAVVVGASDYPNPADDLPDCLADARNMTKLLTNDLQVPSDHIRAVTGGARVSAKAITSQLTWMRNQADADDVILFYYSGHGGQGKSRKSNDEETLSLPSGEQFGESKLAKLLNQFPQGTSKYVILDSCFSGGFAKLGQTLTNTVVAAASRFNETATAYYPDGTPDNVYGGIFTSWLLDGFRAAAADTNHDSRVDLEEAFAFRKLDISLSGGQQPVICGDAPVELARRYLQQSGFNFTRPIAHAHRPLIRPTTFRVAELFD